MADFELFNGTNLEEPDSDHRIAMNKPSLAGAFFVRWDNFKNLIRSFTVSKDTDQSISGNKTFTGIVNVQAPTSDNNPVTLKYFNDNAGGGEEIIEVATYADLPLVGVISVLYVVLDDNVQYRWSGTVYVPMSNPLSYASQAEMELAEPIENTKVVTPLRAWQGFVYWCKNTLFPELNTSDKTIIGSVNELKTNVIKLESNETPAAIADTDNVRFKSATGYYVRTLLAIKNYVKLGLKASEVANDSTSVTGANLKLVLDNADCVAVTSLQDTDMIPFGRANGAVSENKMIEAIDAKTYFTPSPVLYNVTTTSELVTILGAPTCPYTVTINLLQEVELPAILNTYALNILFVGRKVIVSRNVAVNGMRTGVGVISFDVILLITDRSIITVSCFDFMSSFDMRFKDILSNWVDTQYNLKLARGVDSMVSWGANNLISTKLSHDSGQPVIDNDYYVAEYNASYSASYNVTSWQEIVDILAVPTVPNSVVFNVMNDIVGGTLQTYAHNIIIRGCKVTAPSTFSILGFENGIYNINFESLFYINNVCVIAIGDSLLTTTTNVKFKDITSLWYNTSANYNLQCLTNGTGTTASIEYNALTNTKLDTTTTLVPTQNNNYYKWNYYYDIYMFNIDSEIHFLCDRAGKFSVRCRYLCSTTSNRTITLIPPLPLKLNLHDLVTSAIETLGSYPNPIIYGTETINKFRYDTEPLSFGSSGTIFTDLNDKIEYRNNVGIGSAQYTETGGIVDISTSGLTLELNYSGSATGFVRKEIVITGIINRKLQ